MLLDYERIDPELLPALEAFPALDLNRDNIVKMRALLASAPIVASVVSVLEEEQVVSTQDGDLKVYIYRKSRAENQPAVLWVHGGGYILGNAQDERARVIADTCDCTVVSVDYRLAPEHPFPAGPNDCYAALTWMNEQAIELGIDPARIVIGGASAGAGMAAGVVLMNRDKANFPLKLQLLLYPMLDNLHATESGKLENHPVWKQATSFNAWEMYLNGTPGVDANPYAAAARAKDLSRLPPAYICVGATDLFCDEDIAYARRLDDAGVNVELSVFPGVYHAAESFVPNAKVSKRLNASFMSALKDAF
ncbi:MAG: acetyl esterase/lipase [Candidatus Azotimanducaceae bacterium]